MNSGDNKHWNGLRFSMQSFFVSLCVEKCPFLPPSGNTSANGRFQAFPLHSLFWPGHLAASERPYQHASRTEVTTGRMPWPGSRSSGSGLCDRLNLGNLACTDIDQKWSIQVPCLWCLGYLLLPQQPSSLPSLLVISKTLSRFKGASTYNRSLPGWWDSNHVNTCSAFLS